MENIRLNEGDIQRMLKEEQSKICESFPEASLRHTSLTILTIALEIPSTIKWIMKRNYFVMITLFLLFATVGSGLYYTWKNMNITFSGVNIAEFAQMFDASFSFLVLLGSGAYFLFSYQSRARKQKLVRAINKLIGLTHVVESHQLTKDPDHNPYKDSKMLAKYLNYCTDLLALISKIGFLYVQALNEPEAQSIEGDLETLTSGISRKIWQKIMLVGRLEQK
jgi:hypothetical protein